MKDLEADLKASIQGEVHFDQVTRHVYSVDASIFEIVPKGVVIPKTEADLEITVALARQYKVPISLRGAATGITGGCLGEGLIIDLSKYRNQILEINVEQEYAICQPGVVQDDLNHQLDRHGYRLGPDTSTGNRATLGGMLANNSAGARSLRYGKMSDHVLSVKSLLSTSESLTFAPVTHEEWEHKCLLANQEGEIYRILREIKQKDSEEIFKRFPKIPRRVTGYNLDEFLLNQPYNISKLIAGSEGTLGIATEIKMRIVPKLKAVALLLIFFSDLMDAMRQVPELLTFHPISLEMIDHQIITLGRSSATLRRQLEWLTGDPKAIIILEVKGETTQEATEKIKNCLLQVKQKKIGYEWITLQEPPLMEQVWKLRKAGLGILLSKRTYSRAIAFLEDISLPPLKLASFMERFCAYLATHGKEAGIYGHVGSGCMHIRPYIDLRDQQELVLMRQMMLDISSLILEYGGALSGEHGEGWIRSWLNPKMFGDQIMQAFKKLKNAFDPPHLLNPGKKIPTGEPWEHLRTQVDEKLQCPKTFLDFAPEGGFELAADLCNGNALCRKKEGVMCPSFQATNEEFHSTRARAQALRAIIHGKLPLEAFTGDGLHAVMDLCLSCKGCKTECPSQVDMAKFKSEFLYHYQEKHGYPLRNQLFGHIGQINSKLSTFARLSNQLSSTWLVKKGLSWLGISPNRSIPPLAQMRFSTWFSKLRQTPLLNKAVILLNDTFTEFNHPQIGQAAVRLLNALGYLIIVPPWSCCGRPALSKGLLPSAQNQAKQLIATLWPYAERGYPIIGLEPSCLLTLRDDYPTLIQASGEEKQKLTQILSQSFLLDEFLASLVDQNFFYLPFKRDVRKIKVHGHCYQKALVGMKPTLKVLNSVPGFQVEEIPSGCCGMAGSFGYEKEHETISMKIGDLVLFPTIRSSDPDTWIVANGMSCRHQIQDGTHRHPLHLAEALASHINKLAMGR